MFSVVIPLYNKELSIKNTIQSVLNQSYQNFEIVIINDGSTDNSVEAVKTIKDDKLLGVTGFENILWNNGTAVVYIGIGDESFRGEGIGKEALALTLEFGFQELNFHRIQLTVLSYNKPAIALYEGLGFKNEGVYRAYINRDGKRYDMYLYGILRNEWYNNL